MARKRPQNAQMAPNGPAWGPKRPRRGHFWAILDPFWALFWAFSDSFEAPRSHLRPSYASIVTQPNSRSFDPNFGPKWVQNGSKRGSKMGPPEGGTKKKVKALGGRSGRPPEG